MATETETCELDLSEDGDNSEESLDLPEEILYVNESPEYNMPPPNDGCGNVNGLGSVIYGPPDVREQISSVLKKHRRTSKQYKEFKSEHEWWGVHVNGRPDIQHFHYIWNSHLLEDILYDSEIIMKMLYRTAVNGFHERNRRKLLETIKRTVVSNDEKVYSVKVPDEVLPVSIPECRSSITKALPLITNWLCACYCFEEEFWINHMQIFDNFSMSKFAHNKTKFKFRGVKSKSKASTNKTNTETKELTAYERMRQQSNERDGEQSNTEGTEEEAGIFG